MPFDYSEILIDDIAVQGPHCQLDKNIKQGLGSHTVDCSQWILREFGSMRDFHIEKFCFDFFRFFSPAHVVERKSVFDIVESKKKWVGSAISPVYQSDTSVLDTVDFHLLSAMDVGSAISILFFLNQPYARLQYTMHNLVACYQIAEFGDLELHSALSEEAYLGYINVANRSDLAVAAFFARIKDSLQVSFSRQYSSRFLFQIEASLLNVVIAPDFNLLFDFSHCEDVLFASNKRREKLRDILLLSDRFSSFIFEMTPSDFNQHFSRYFSCLKQYDQEKFPVYRDRVVKNFALLMRDFLLSKYNLVISDLLNHIVSSSIPRKQAPVQRVYDAWKIKVTLCQFYLLLHEGTFFYNDATGNIVRFFNSIRVLAVLVSFLDTADVCRAPFLNMAKLVESMQSSHPVIADFLLLKQDEVFNTLGPSHEIDLDEMMELVPEWLMKTEQVGLHQVLFHKNTLLMMFDRSVQLVYGKSEPISLVKLRESFVQSTLSAELHLVLYKLIKTESEIFLMDFFRQLLSHCYFESRMLFFMQQVLLVDVIDSGVIANEIRSLLDIAISNEKIKLFWTRLGLHLQGDAQLPEWCVIEESPVVQQPVVSQSSFFGSLVRSADRLASAATAAASGESAQSMKDSLEVFATKASGSMKTAAGSAHEALSSIGSALGAWWSQKD